MAKEMISIAMATYNGEKYLREQLDSILAQTHQNFELIVCMALWAKACGVRIRDIVGRMRG